MKFDYCDLQAGGKSIMLSTDRGSLVIFQNLLIMLSREEVGVGVFRCGRPSILTYLYIRLSSEGGSLDITKLDYCAI